MTFPVYQKNSIRINQEADLDRLITKEINLYNPVIVEFETTSKEEETKLIHLLQKHLEQLNLNPRFPYAIYVITQIEIEIPLSFVCQRSKGEIPKFFTQKDARLNLKESHLMDKIRLLQQESGNCSSLENMNSLQRYAKSHRLIHVLDQERLAYKNLLRRLKRDEG
jgi:hypothetical protein